MKVCKICLDNNPDDASICRNCNSPFPGMQAARQTEAEITLASSAYTEKDQGAAPGYYGLPAEEEDADLAARREASRLMEDDFRRQQEKEAGAMKETIRQAVIERFRSFIKVFAYLFEGDIFSVAGTKHQISDKGAKDWYTGEGSDFDGIEKYLLNQIDSRKIPVPIGGEDQEIVFSELERIVAPAGREFIRLHRDKLLKEFDQMNCLI